MSDVEFLLNRNWEQRRHAEEFAAMVEAEEWDRKDREVIRIANRERIATAPVGPADEKRKLHRQTPPEDAGPADEQRKLHRQTPPEDAGPRNDKSGYGSKGWKVKAARAGGRMALVMSAASALAGLELLFPLFGLVAVIFYTLYFEFQKGRNRLWFKI